MTAVADTDAIYLCEKNMNIVEEVRYQYDHVTVTLRMPSAYAEDSASDKGR